MWEVRGSAEMWVWFWPLHWDVGELLRCVWKAEMEGSVLCCDLFDSNQNKERFPKGDLDFSWELRAFDLGGGAYPSSESALISPGKSFSFFYIKEKKKVSQGYNLLDMDSLILQRGFSLVKPCLHFILLAAVKWTNWDVGKIQSSSGSNDVTNGSLVVIHVHAHPII